MTQAKQGDTVKVHYTGRLEDGTRFDSSEGREPIELTLGAGGIIPGFETSVVGMTPGETKTVTIPSDEAYGDRRNEMVQQVDRSQIPPEVDLKPGAQLRATGSDGRQFLVRVLEVADESVTIDANHPLAGQDLTFEIELVEIV